MFNLDALLDYFRQFFGFQHQEPQPLYIPIEEEQPRRRHKDR